VSKWIQQQPPAPSLRPFIALHAKKKKEEANTFSSMEQSQLEEEFSEKSSISPLAQVLEEWRAAAASKWQERPTRPSLVFYDAKDKKEKETTSLSASIEPQLEESPAKVLLPLARVLEESTDGWALEYADLSPDTPTTPAGIGFLATNLAYTLCGLLLVAKGNVLLGVLTELASVASFAYHFAQLKLGKNQPLVRVALLVDYVVAAATLLAALVFIIQVGIQNVPLEGIIASVLAVVFLFLSWVWEEGIPYVINHGLWHLLGAYGGFVIGQSTF
jgi:hypothetical protein